METVKGVSNLVKEIGDIELNRKIIDLQTEVYELIEENHRLKAMNEELLNVKKIEGNLIFKSNVYYLKNGTEEKGPYCSTCWDKDKKLINMHENSYELYYCPAK